MFSVINLYPLPIAKPLRFFDVCAGIGGGRLGLMQAGLQCVGYSEIDPLPAKTYDVMHAQADACVPTMSMHQNWGDLMTLNPHALPDFEVLIGGFPCQTFSIAGKRAGFEDDRGLVIHGILNILQAKQVPYFILENVKGLVSHDQGRTLKTVLALLNQAGYWVQYAVLDSADYGVPQMRERIYFVGMRHGYYQQLFQWPAPVASQPLQRYLHPTSHHRFTPEQPAFETFRRYLNNRYNQGRYTVETLLAEEGVVLDTRQSDLRRYTQCCPTLRTGRHGILYVHEGAFYKLSPLEALALQGFPLEHAQKAIQAGISSTRLLSQAGNAMTVPVIHALARELLKCGKSYALRTSTKS
jgi:DNA (cytosine-5)-methyltransferase 1